MSKKVYTTSIEEFEGREIYINITLLEKGIYELRIIDKNAIVKNTLFIKK